MYAEPKPVSDFLGYKNLAAHFVSTHQIGYEGPSGYRMPGYIVFLSIFGWISWDNFWLSFVNLMLDMAVAVQVYVLGRKLFGAAAGLWGFGLYAWNPIFICFSVVPASEHLFMALLLGSIIAALAGNREKYLPAVFSGILLGGAILTRGEGLFYILPIGFLIMCFKPHKASGPTRRAWKQAAIFTGLTVFLLIPWYIRNRVTIGSGAGLSTTGGLNFYFAHNAHQYGYHSLEQTPMKGMARLEAQKAGYRRGWQYIKSEPLSLFRSAGWGTVRLYLIPPFYALNWCVREAPLADEPAPGESDWAMTILAGQGQLWQVKDLGGLKIILLFIAAGHGVFLLGGLLFLLMKTLRTRRNLVVIGGVILMNWTGYCVIFWAKPRYALAAEVLLCLATGAVVATVIAAIKKRTSSRQMNLSINMTTKNNQPK